MPCPGAPRVKGVAEAVDVPRVGRQPVPVPTVVGHDGARTALDEAQVRPGEVGVAEGEDPVAAGGHHAHDGGVGAVGQTRAGRTEPEPGKRAVEPAGASPKLNSAAEHATEELTRAGERGSVARAMLRL